MTAYYNEIDPAAAHVIRTLIDADVIAPGDVDTRSIKDVMPDDLIGYRQCHFFAGGGLWSVAARLAGWPDDLPLWTGSCPCQPFSAAGKGLGTDDPRHLWPDFHRLIRARRPPVVVGEQVAGAAGYGWFDGVRADLAGEGYAGRAVDFPACSVNAPHQRNRLYWIAVNMGDAVSEPRERGTGAVPRAQAKVGGAGPAHGDCADRSANADEGQSSPPVHGIGSGLERQSGNGNGSWGPQEDRPAAEADGAIAAGVPSDADSSRRLQPQRPIAFERRRSRHGDDRRNGTYWSDADWIICHDGKARRAQPGIRLLVDGLPGRVDLWRIGGNAIVPQAAAEVLAALLDTIDARAAA